MLLVVTHTNAVVGFAVGVAERGERAVIDRATIALLVREGMTGALLFVLGPLGLGQAPPVPSGREPPPADSPAAHRPPVILIPGYGLNRSSLAFLRTFLVHRGWTWVWAVNVATREANLADMAAELGRRVEELRRTTGAVQVDLVGQSLGGLVAAWYVRHLGGAEHVRRLVTLGTPWRGTRLAVFARAKVAEELLYDSPALDGLAPPPVPTVAVWSAEDTIVVPAASAAPDGAETVCIEGIGHTEMLLSSRAFRAVQAALSHRPATVAPRTEEVPLPDPAEAR